MKRFENKLKGGHPNSLGNTLEVVKEVLNDVGLFESLFQCYFSDDEVVRLRTSSAMKRIGKENPQLLVPYINRFIDEISMIDQASTQWTLAQLFDLLHAEMSESQIKSAKKILKKNLRNHSDWIVINTTIEILSQWARNDPALKKWLIPMLQKHAIDSRKSIANRAQKWIEKLLS